MLYCHEVYSCEMFRYVQFCTQKHTVVLAKDLPCYIESVTQAFILFCGEVSIVIIIVISLLDLSRFLLFLEK